MRKRWSHRSGAAMIVSAALLFPSVPTAAAAPPPPPSTEPATPPQPPAPPPTIEDWGWGSSSAPPAPAPEPPPPLRNDERVNEPVADEAAEIPTTEDPSAEERSADSDALPRPLWLAGISLSVAGGAALASGFVGLGLGAHRQKQAEDADLYGDAYDEVAAKGRRANVVAGVGLGLGAALLGSGLILLLVDGRRARKSVAAGGNVPELRVTLRGVGISGRF